MNCRDHAVRMEQKKVEGVARTKLVSFINVNIEGDKNHKITLMNDGNGID